MHIEPITQEHAAAIRRIHEEGIATGIATFENDSPPWEEWDKSHLPFGRLVAIDNGDVVGWAALTPISSRCVYAGVAEVSVYVTSAARGKGIGKALLEKLVEAGEQHAIWTLQAGIIAENTASIALHHVVGFRTVGVREKLGQYKNKWHDVALLERRSKQLFYDA